MARMRAALITGGNRGIGLSIAHALAGDGIPLMINGLGEKQELTVLGQTLQDTHDVTVSTSGADLSDPHAVEALVGETVEIHGRLNVLINCAGIQHVEALDAFPVDRWNAILAVNLSAAFHTTRLAIPQMQSDGWGRIINIASAHGLVASPYKVPYVAAKHGLVGLTKGTALEVGFHGITCNAICPGFVDTPMFQLQADRLADRDGRPSKEIVREQLSAKQAIPELISPAEIGELAAFLCTDAARSITGTAIPIDGGWTAQ